MLVVTKTPQREQRLQIFSFAGTTFSAIDGTLIPLGGTSRKRPFVRETPPPHIPRASWPVFLSQKAAC